MSLAAYKKELLEHPVGPPWPEPIWDGLDRCVAYYDRDGEPITMREWATIMENEAADGWLYRRVAHNFVGPYSVSTVWLGLDHSFLASRPLIFETMIFDSTKPDLPAFGEPYPEGGTCWTEEYQERYTTEQAALEGHYEAVELARLHAFLWIIKLPWRWLRRQWRGPS